MKISNFNSIKIGNQIVNAIAVGANKIWSAVKYIVFKDPYVETICAKKWGDGLGITEEQAKTVTYMDYNDGFFQNGSITSFDELTYFSNLETIGERAFYYCEGLTSITIPNSVMSIGECAFQYCRGLTSLKFEEGSNLTSIGNAAFGICSNIEKIELPDTVNSLGTTVFRSCPKLKDLNIPNGLSNVTDWLTMFSNALANTKPPIIRINITNIHYQAFKNATSMCNVIIQKDVQTIGEEAFIALTNLEEVNFDNAVSLTSIGNRAFYNCSGITSPLLMPASLSSIGLCAFYGCLNIPYISFKNHTFVPTIKQTDIFRSIHPNTTIVVPDNLYDQWIQAQYWEYSADKIVKVSEFNG